MPIGKLWDGLKGAVFESDGTVAEQAPAAQAPQGATAPAPAPTAAPAFPRQPASTVSFTPAATVNQDMVNAIRKQTFGRNTALTALIAASDTLTDVIPDPVMRLKAAQKMAGAGRGAKELAEAVQIHLNDVDATELAFGQQLEGKINAEVGGLRSQVASRETLINSATAEIQNLQKRIQTLQEQINTSTHERVELMAQASAKEAELRQANEEFKAAAGHVRAELNGHKNTILSTLG